MNKRETFVLCHLFGVRRGVGKTVSHQDDFTAQIPNGFHLHRRRRHRHHDHRTAPQSFGGQRHALRMIAGRRADYAAGSLFFGEMHHLIESAAQFEGKNGLRVFAL